MSEEELVFQLLEEERKARTKRIATEKRITTEDCLVIGVFRLNREIDGLYRKMDEIEMRINGINGRIDDTKESLNKRIDWLIALIIVMWMSIMLAIIFV